VKERLAGLERAAEALEIGLSVGFEARPAGGGAPADVRVVTARVRSGDTVELGTRASTAFVAGWNVEVAADSGAAAPLVGTALTGDTLHLTACRVEGGAAVHVEGVLDLSELVGLTDFDPETVDLGVLQQPLVRSVQVVFSGRIAHGERLAVELAGTPLSRPDRTLWIEAESTPDPAGDADPAEDGGGWRVLDLAFVARPAGGLPAARPGAGIDDWARQEALAGPLEPLPPSAVAGQVESARRAGGGPREPLHWAGTLLFVPASDPDAVREAESLVRAAEAARLATHTVAIVRGGLRATLPVSAGRPARLRVGEERTWLVDYTVEIAPETWMAEPHIAKAFDGLVLDLLGDEDGVTCAGWIAASAPPAVVSAEHAQLGRLQLPARTFQSDQTKVRAGSAPAHLFAAEAGAGVTLSVR
jgi:hypothetical protein